MISYPALTKSSGVRLSERKPFSGNIKKSYPSEARTNIERKHFFILSHQLKVYNCPHRLVFHHWNTSPYFLGLQR